MPVELIYIPQLCGALACDSVQFGGVRFLGMNQ